MENAVDLDPGSNTTSLARAVHLLSHLKPVMCKALLLPLLSLLTLVSAFSQIATGIVEPAPGYNTLIPPSAGASYVDPVFGSSIMRVSNAL